MGVLEPKEQGQEHRRKDGEEREADDRTHAERKKSGSGSSWSSSSDVLELFSLFPASATFHLPPRLPIVRNETNNYCSHSIWLIINDYHNNYRQLTRRQESEEFISN